MESSLALTIIGSTMGLVGMIFIFIPKLVNNKIMGQIPVEAVDISAKFRGFGKELPILPIVLFFILATIAFISS